MDTVPSDYFLGDRDIYVKSLRSILLMYSKPRDRPGHEQRAQRAGHLRSELRGAETMRQTFDDRSSNGQSSFSTTPNNATLENDDRRPLVDLGATQIDQARQGRERIPRQEKRCK